MDPFSAAGLTALKPGHPTTFNEFCGQIWKRTVKLINEYTAAILGMLSFSFVVSLLSCGTMIVVVFIGAMVVVYLITCEKKKSV
jgi:hypothetical protein